jgi:hypothetical protein
MSRVLCLLVASGCAAVTAVKLSSYEQGAEFDKCISNADFQGKTLEDDITLIDRDANGCCPAGSVPGAKHYNQYVGAQVICGFKSDGTVATSTSTSNSVTTCTYNHCYVYKQDLSCVTGKQRLNGCCAAPASCATNACGFETDCKNYAYNIKDVNNENVEYCLTYHKNYKLENTVAKNDDQADHKLQVDKLYVYTACAAPAATASGAVRAAASIAALLLALVTLQAL